MKQALVKGQRRTRCRLEFRTRSKNKGKTSGTFRSEADGAG